MKFEEAWYYFSTIKSVFVYKNNGKGGVRYRVNPHEEIEGLRKQKEKKGK